MKSPKERNIIMYSEAKNLDQNSMNKDVYTISFKAIINQEIQFEENDNERSLCNLALEDLNNKVEIYKHLFFENKINMFNAFEIDLISCVLQVVKKTKETNFLEISNTFDAMSKVYTCRVDDFLTMGNKLVKEFLLEVNHTKLQRNEVKKKPNRNKIMLTTAEKLHLKEHLILSKIKYSSINLDNDIFDYAKPSRILINKFSCTTYWPEHNFSKKNSVINNECQKGKYEMENISFLTSKFVVNNTNFLDMCNLDQIEKGKICPYYHKFMAECDDITNDDDLNKVNNIITYFDPETSALSIENSEESYELMDININEQNSETMVDESSLPNYKNKSIGSQNKLVSISRTLSIVDTKFSDYTFFDPKRLRYFKCPYHWKDKFKRMIMTNKQKKMYIKSCVAINDFQTSTTIYVSKEQCNKSKNIQFKVDFNVNITAIMKKLKSNIVKHQCDYSSWKPCNNITPNTNRQKMNLFRRLDFCKYLKVIPDWYKNEGINGLIELQGSTSMLPEQDISKKNVLSKEISNETLEITDKSISNICKTFDENYINEAEISSDYNYIIQDGIHEALKKTKCIPGYIDMNVLKKNICNIIKPDGNKTLNVTFKDLLLKLPKLLTEKTKENINVAIIYVALLHLSNEQNLHLQNDNDEIIISQG